MIVPLPLMEIIKFPVSLGAGTQQVTQAPRVEVATSGDGGGSLCRRGGAAEPSAGGWGSAAAVLRPPGGSRSRPGVGRPARCPVTVEAPAGPVPVGFPAPPHEGLVLRHDRRALLFISSFSQQGWLGGRNRSLTDRLCRWREAPPRGW